MISKETLRPTGQPFCLKLAKEKAKISGRSDQKQLVVIVIFSRTRSCGKSIAQPAFVDFEQSQHLRTGDLIETFEWKKGCKASERLRLEQ